MEHTSMKRRSFIRTGALFVPTIVGVVKAQIPMSVGDGAFVGRHRSTGYADLPSNYSGLVAWWKADTIVQSDNTAVTSWADSSGLSNTLSQGTGGNQPKFRTNIQNGLPAVQFDGTNDFLSMTTKVPYTTNPNSPYTIIVINEVTNNVSGNRFFYSTVTGDGAIRNNNSFGLQVLAVATRTSDAYTTTFNNVWNMCSVSSTGPGTVDFFDKATAKGNRVSLSAAPSFNQMCDSIGPFGGYIGEACIWTSALSAANIASLYNNYFSLRWGI